MLSKKDIISCILIFLLPVGMSLFFKDRLKGALDKKEPSPYLISMEALKGKDVLWIDARPEKKFEVKHIPGAILLNEYDWDGGRERLFKALENFDPEGPFVVYCNEGCFSSEAVANRLRQEFEKENVYFLKGGMKAWFEAQ